MHFDTSSNIIFSSFLSIFYAVVTSELIQQSLHLDIWLFTCLNVDAFWFTPNPLCIIGYDLQLNITSHATAHLHMQCSACLPFSSVSKRFIELYLEPMHSPCPSASVLHSRNGSWFDAIHWGDSSEQILIFECCPKFPKCIQNWIEDAKSWTIYFTK